MAADRYAVADELISCPVCLEHYRDPRMLRCAHQFCQVCLSNIESGRGDTGIPCPTCRVVTPLSPGSGVGDLPRPVLMNEAQGVIEELLQGPRQTRGCRLCVGVETEASRYCYDCHDSMCDVCYSEHQGMSVMAGHKTVPVCPALFSTVHDGVVTVYCADCQVTGCNTCARHSHKAHNTDTIRTVADRSRDKLRQITEECSVSDELIATKLQQLESGRVIEDGHYNSVINKLDQSVVLVDELRQRILDIKQDLISRKAESDSDVNAYKARLERHTGDIELCGYLLNVASDPEVVARAGDLPHVDTLSSLPWLPSLEYPVLIDEGEHLVNNIQALIEGVSVKYESIGKHGENDLDNDWCYGDGLEGDLRDWSPEIRLTPIAVYDTEGKSDINIWDVVINPKTSQLVVRTENPKYPLDIYNVNDNYMTRFGDKILSKAGHITFDYNRDSYLATRGQYVITVNGNGQCDSKVKISGSELSCISYMRDSSLCVVSDVVCEDISFIDTRMLSIVTSFTTKDVRNRAITPHGMYSGSVGGTPTVVVSDKVKHIIGVHKDIHGSYRLSHTYDCYYGDGDDAGQVFTPGGVVTDQSGHVIVCDTTNDRVVALWGDGEEVEWECLLTSTHLGGKPASIDIDTDNNTLAVVVDSSIHTYSYK